MGQFDFTTGQTPIKLGDHSARHEDGGADEISLTDLSGDPADTINESLLTTQNDIIVRGASIAERLNIAASRIVARLASGNLVAATPAQILAILTGTAGATFDWNSQSLTGVNQLTATQINAFTLGGTLTVGGQIFDAGSGYVEIDTTGDAGLQMDGGITTGGIAPVANIYNRLATNFASGIAGTATRAVGFQVDGIFTAAANTTILIAGARFTSNISTQNDSDTIGYVAQVSLDEPSITKGATDTITLAATLYIGGAPTEGVTNAALYVVSGDTNLSTVTLRGKLTGGAQEIEGSNFDIDGGTVDGVTITSPTIQGTVAAGTGLTMPDFTLGGTIIGAIARTFLTNTFLCPAPATEWIPVITGIKLSGTQSAKKVWLPLNFLKIGDIITSYNLVGDVVADVTEDFTTYTEVDANNKLTVIATKATAVDADRDENVYLYKDFTADYFDALDVDFEIYLDTNALDDGVAGMAISNTVGTIHQFAATDVSVAVYRASGPGDIMYLYRGARVANDAMQPITDNQLYYCTLSRTAGNDSVTLYIYDDSGRTNLVDTLVVADFGTVKWRYAYGFVNLNTGAGGYDFDGYVQNLVLNRAVLDCKLVQVNKANPLTTTDITNGGITQITADGNFDSQANCSDTTVATDKQYLLEIQGSTTGSVEIYVIGAEVAVTRLV